MRYISCNFEIIRKDKFSIPFKNRAFKYGDGFFETISARNGKILFWKKHSERIQRAIQILKLEVDWDEKKFEKHLVELMLENEKDHARIRVQWWRNGNGFYMPTDNKSSFFIELFDVDNIGFDIIEIAETKIFTDYKKEINTLYSFKNLGSTLYILASLFSKENNVSECVLLNNYGRICEGSRSNIFVVVNGNCYTPPLTDGCISGVLREVLLEELDFVIEKKMDASILSDADEIFFSNTSGIISVQNYQGNVLEKKIAEQCSAILKRFI